MFGIAVLLFLILCVLATIAKELKELRQMLALREDHLSNAMRKLLDK